MNILEERGITSNDMIFTAFTCYQSVRMCMCVFSPAFVSLNTALCRYFLQGCATEDPIIQLYEYEDYIRSGIGSASYFIIKMKDTIPIKSITKVKVKEDLVSPRRKTTVDTKKTTTFNDYDN